MSDIIFIEEKNKQSNQPLFLYDMYYTDSDILRYTEFDSDLVYDGNTYIAAPIKHLEIKENIRQTTSEMTVRVGNADRVMQYYLENHDGLRGRKVVTYMVWRNQLDNIDGAMRAIYYVDHAKDYDAYVDFILSTKFDLMRLYIPNRVYTRTHCYWKFKDEDCKYAGEESVCNHTLLRCDELDNTINFGAFPGVPSITVLYG